MVKTILVAVVVALASFAAAWFLLAHPQQMVVLAVTPEQAERQAYARKSSNIIAPELNSPNNDLTKRLASELSYTSKQIAAVFDAITYCATTQIIERLEPNDFTNMKTLVDGVVTPDTLTSEAREEFGTRFFALARPALNAFKVSFGDGPLNYCGKLELAKLGLKPT